MADHVRMLLELLERQLFDLVILDLVLPRLHGLYLLDVIRSRWPKIPIIATSGNLSGSAGHTVFKGSAEFIEKPIKLEKCSRDEYLACSIKINYLPGEIASLWHG